MERVHLAAHISGKFDNILSYNTTQITPQITPEERTQTFHTDDLSLTKSILVVLLNGRSKFPSLHDQSEAPLRFG